jgi:zinc transport system substrate-binding protein
MRTRIVLIFVLGVMLALTACGGDSAGDAATQIVAAFYPLAFLAEQVAPDADVTNITPAGAEPHDLELTARDAETMDRADLVLYLGSGFQPALEKAVSGHVNALDLLAGDLGDRASQPDPHIWLDPGRYATMARTVAGAVGDATAADELVAALEQLDLEFRKGLADCERREIVTSHAAFGHLADAYGLRQIALTGLSPEAEPSAKDLEDLISTVEREGATTVFFETLVSPDLAETVAREARVETAVLDPLEGLSEDDLDAGADYFTVMRDNLSALRQALGCR